MDTNLTRTLEHIARVHLDIETLESRKSDSLDFYDVAVWTLREALEAAYQAGRSDALKAADRAAAKAQD